MADKNKIMEMISIDKLKPAPEHAEVFAYFKREYQALKRKLRVEGFDENCPLIVRKTKGGTKGMYDVLCGVGRHEIVKESDNHETIAKRSPSELLCEIVDVTSEEAIILILKDNFYTCRAITGFTDFQYRLYRIIASMFFLLVDCRSRINIRKINRKYPSPSDF